MCQWKTEYVLRKIWKSLQEKLKTLTDDGKKRKKRIIDTVLFQPKFTQLVLNFYTSVLPLLSAYIKLFQTKEPLIHRVYDNITQLFKDFLCCFIKQEHLKGKSEKGLKMMNLDDDKQHLYRKDMFVGNANKEIISKLHAKDKSVVDFLSKTSEAYSN